MKLHIEDPDQVLDYEFIFWLMRQIKRQIFININNKKLKRWDKFFSDNSLYKSIDNTTLSAKYAIELGARNLVFKDNEGSFDIYINPNIYIIGFDRLHLISVCKLINYGNKSVAPYPIFTKVFNHFSVNIQEYIDTYINIRILRGF